MTHLARRRVVAVAQGALLAVGGGEDKREGMVVLRRALEHAPAARRVVIVPTASASPLWTAAPHVEAFRGIGASDVQVLDIRSRDQAALEEHVDQVRRADLVFMTGGDQARLSAALLGTPVLSAMRETLADGGVIAGTSAGAAAMSAVMIAEGEASLRKGSVRFTPGLGLLDGAILDTHFMERGRFARLVDAVATHPRHFGIGLGEDTAILVRGRDVEVVGGGSVVVLDGGEMRSTNVEEADHGEPLQVERMIVHTHSDGGTFRLRPDPAAGLSKGVRARA